MIVAMAKLQVLGPRRLLAETLGFLQQEGVLELRRRPEGAATSAEAIHVVPVELGEAPPLRDAIARIDTLLARLPPGRGEPLTLPPPGTPRFLDALDHAEAELHALDERRAALLAERQSLIRLARLLTALAPIRAETPPPPRARAFGLALRRERGDALPLLEAEVARLTGGAGVVRATDAGDGELAVLLLVPVSRAGEIAALLFERGVEELKVPGQLENASPARALVQLRDRERAIAPLVAELDAERAARAGALRPALVEARRSAAASLARLEAVSSCAETAHAFVVWGWAPRDRVAPLTAAAARAFGDRVAIAEFPIAPGEQGEVPVVLRNPAWLAPFQLLLALVPLPRYGSLDPTPWLALFFPLFFGIMLGDVGFGVLAVAVGLLARLRGWGGVRGSAIATIAIACGVSAALFGALFGEAFGTLGEHLGLHPVLLDRREALFPLIGLVLAVGLGHLVVGLALGAWQEARHGAVREAVGRAARLAMLVGATAGAACALGALPRAGTTPALLVAGACALLAVACEGPMALLEAVLSLGNVLSYARLAALGLASVMLAEVANGMPAALPGGGGMALAIGLHAVNFTLGVVSPAIAALRLQVVEFFDKFYREGGHPYRPFALA